VRGRVLEDRGYDELAAAAGVSPAAIRQRVSRGLALLRTRLEKETP
jgi:DNA-directed RNA polymerase specialized sigma24 family protein